ncbi:MAG TPA: mechanosensitive ion channel family protein [Dongiaceae bacterium]|nr:mechanosensitive ion channel family protein [Dongiaceae bacterium]
MRLLRMLLLTLSAWLALLPALDVSVLAGSAMAQQNAAAPTTASSPSAAEPQADPAKLRQLLDLLNDPGIKAWLAQGQQQATTGKAPGDKTAGSGGAMTAMGMPGIDLEQSVDANIAATRSFLRELAASAPSLPGELEKAWLVLSIDLEHQGMIGVVLALVLFAALGFGVEKLFWRATAGFRHRMIAIDLNSARTRFRAAGYRLIYGLGMVLAFAIGSIGAFLLLEWQPLLQYIVLSYLQVILIVRIVLVLGRFLLAPSVERFRLVPMTSAAARFWHLWAGVITCWFFLVQHTLRILVELGVAHHAVVLIGLPSGLVLLGIALYVVWASPEKDGIARVRRSHRIAPWLVSLYLVAVWLMLFTGSVKPFYIGVVLLLLPIAIRGVNQMMENLLQPGAETTAEDQVAPLIAVSLERGLRAVLLIGAAWVIASLLGIDLSSLPERDTLPMRLLRGGINAAIVILLANFCWHLLRSWIDQQVVIASALSGGPHGGEGDEARRYARLRTLFPILKNVLFVVILVLTIMIALSALGFEIGPLVAGAGVVGVAVGFGAQTLVKDIISGIFFLLDDAFRVGEYIESGSIRGTVESFSLRSMKLRHHRGALHTIPFGSIEKITNYSRDWVIDKITVSVTYETDLDLVKKVIKDIGKKLQADPEFAPHILETLKMQGVEQFGDFAIQIRMKMMTKPGEQFVIRRRAYALIKQSFDANGINFAFPTVTVSGSGASNGAIAKAALDILHPVPTE